MSNCFTGCEAFYKTEIPTRQRYLASLRGELIELALEIFQLATRISQLSLGRESLVVGKVLRRGPGERVDIRRGFRGRGFRPRRRRRRLRARRVRRCAARCAGGGRSVAEKRRHGSLERRRIGETILQCQD